MDTLDTHRNLLFGLLAFKMGFVSGEALVNALNVWSLKKDTPLERVLETSGALSAKHSVLVAESFATLLQAQEGDARAAVASLGPIRANFEGLADRELMAALPPLEDAPEEDPFATRAFSDGDAIALEATQWSPGDTAGDPSATRAFGGEPPTIASSSPGDAGFPTTIVPSRAKAAPPPPIEASAPATIDSSRTVVPSHGPAMAPPQPDPMATQFDAQVASTVVPVTRLAGAAGHGATGVYGGLPTIADMPTSAGGGDLYATRASEVEPTLMSRTPAARLPAGDGASHGIRYRTLRPHAKGGLGEVFVALDEELGREVALKEIQERHADRIESRSRFILEAEVTGCLEHPGIVPVYGLGQYPDGRPYYAMRFIRGTSLKEAIDDFHKADESPRDPGERELQFRQLLTRFNDVCDAMAYAHSRGILHRDIKPANIMLGSFGETLVVDWGLAKALDRPEAAQDPEMPQLRPMSALSGNSSETVFGSTIGTPHYMSPEQAAGRLDLLGPPSDIYSLGATLYCLLSGKTPFTDRDLATLLAKVQKGDFPPPRQVKPGVPAPLDAICMKAMALKPEDRYPSALALAGDIEHWMADEPVSVYREPLSVRLARWAKRHKTLVTTTGALLLMAVIALATGAVLIRREQQRTEANFQLARAAVDQMLTELGQVDLADIPQMEPVRKKMLGEALAFYETFLKKRGNDPTIRHELARANVRLGDIQEMLGDYSDAERAYDRAIALLGPLVAARPAQADLRRDLASANHNLGLLLKKSSRFDESKRALSEALRLRKQLAGEDAATPDDKQAEKNTVYHLGALLARTGGSRQEVEGAYREAIDAQKRLAAQSPDRPGYRSDLARYLNNQGILLAKVEPTSAEKVYREALAIQEDLAKRSPTVASYQWQLARTLSNLGTPLEYDKDFDGAAATYRKALDRIRALADDYPSVPDYQNELAAIHHNLGMVLVRRKGDPDAEANLRSALEIGTKLLKRFPNRPDYRLKTALNRRALGILDANSGRKTDAEGEFRQSREILAKLVEEYPKVPEYQSELGLALDSEALLLDTQGHVADAAKLVREAIGHQRTALESSDQNSYYRQYLLTDYQYLEKMLGYLGDFGGCASSAEDLAHLLADEPRAHLLAARLLVRAATLIAADAHLPQGKKAEEVKSLADRAMAQLQEAVRRGLKPVKSLKDPLFDVLRKREDFRKLEASLAAPVKAA